MHIIFGIEIAWSLDHYLVDEDNFQLQSNFQQQNFLIC